MLANTKYKDSVFSLLFSDPGVLRELYSAIEGIDLPPDTPVSINTLSDILYMDQINDISFTIDNRLVVLIEHQSTINRNMPPRLLMYIARVYEKIVDRKKLYQSRPEKIPEPEFIVLYNGKADYPDHAALKLSELFKDAVGLKAAVSAAALELIVHVYNINKGRNAALLARCETLGGYSAFIGKIREYEKTMSREEAMKAAIKHCMDNNILKPFLKTHSSEVFNMLITEWSTEEAIAFNREEAWEEGWEKGQEEILKLLKTGKSPEEIIREYGSNRGTQE